MQVPQHPALALDNRGAWHALSLEASQQLIGPLRLCADMRFALDSDHPWPGVKSISPSTPARILRHVACMRPALVDSTYGVDLVVPGSKGAARLVAWYAPMRKEGMLELRLL